MSRTRVDFVISRVLAVVLPLGALAFGFDYLVSTQTRDAKRQLENAGQLLNGEVLKIPVTQAIHKRMAHDPNLVLIGNSFANTNIQLSQLGTLLGMGGGSTVRLSIPNTIGSHWYALLKHRVFQSRYESPDVIVIVSDLQSALLNEPLSEGSYQNLLSLMDGPDPVIEARVERSSSFLYETVLENRAKVRRTAINTVREASARRVLRDAPRGKVRRLTNDAMDRVFHASRTDPTLGVAAMPVTVGQESTQVALGDLPTAADSFLPEIAKLCHEHGARLVMVRNKESPLMPPGQGDIVPAGTIDAVRAAIGEWGGVLIDMDPVPMVAAHYDNLDHMTVDGSKRFTAAVAEALTDLGVSDDREHYVRPLPPSQTDAPPSTVPTPLSTVRRSWRHIESGATARWSWDEPWPGGPETFRLRAVIEAVGEAGPPIVRVGELTAPTLELPSGRWIAELSAPPPEGPWEISIEAAQGAVIVEGLEVGTGSTPLYLAGYRPDVRGHRLELLGRIEVFDGVLYRDAVKPIFPSTTPDIRKAGRNLSRAPGPAASLETPKLSALSDNHTRNITPLRARCSPLRMAENGEPLPYPNVGCKEVRELGKGRMCHADRRVFFSATDTSHPLRNGRDYELFLDPEHSCDGGFWTYAGDVVRLPVPLDRLRELRDGAITLEIDVGVAEIRKPPFHFVVRVLVDGAERTMVELDAVTLRSPVKLPLDPPIQPDDDVEILFENTGGEAWAIVNRAALIPPPIVWESFQPQEP